MKVSLGAAFLVALLAFIMAAVITYVTLAALREPVLLVGAVAAAAVAFVAALILEATTNG
jgi:hypothetical protein